VSGDEHDIRVRLRNAGGNGPYSAFGDELDRDARLRIRVLQIEDELRQVFDAIDVVVRGRGDEAYAGG